MKRSGLGMSNSQTESNLYVIKPSKQQAYQKICNENFKCHTPVDKSTCSRYFESFQNIKVPELAEKCGLR